MKIVNVDDLRLWFSFSQKHEQWTCSNWNDCFNLIAHIYRLTLPWKSINSHKILLAFCDCFEQSNFVTVSWNRSANARWNQQIDTNNRRTEPFISKYVSPKRLEKHITPEYPSGVRWSQGKLQWEKEKKISSFRIEWNWCWWQRKTKQSTADHTSIYMANINNRNGNLFLSIYIIELKRWTLNM